MEKFLFGFYLIDSVFLLAILGVRGECWWLFEEQFFGIFERFQLSPDHFSILPKQVQFLPYSTLKIRISIPLLHSPSNQLQPNHIPYLFSEFSILLGNFIL